MVDFSTSQPVKVHRAEDVIYFKNKTFYPSSEWNYTMRGNMQEVIPRLFLGPYTSALKQSKSVLLQQGITHIICVRSSSEAHFIYPQLEENFTYLTLEIVDDCFESILRFIRKVNGFINDAFKKKGKVLVHGNAGVSRSAALVIAYVMESRNLSNLDALRLVKEKRGCIRPNDGFAWQLHEYEVMYKNEKFFANGGGSSKLNLSLKRKHVEVEKSDMMYSPIKAMSQSKITLRC